MSDLFCSAATGVFFKCQTVRPQKTADIRWMDADAESLELDLKLRQADIRNILHTAQKIIPVAFQLAPPIAPLPDRLNPTGRLILRDIPDCRTYANPEHLGRLSTRVARQHVAGNPIPQING